MGDAFSVPFILSCFLGHTRASTVLAWPIFVYFAHSVLVSNVADNAWHCLPACLKTRADLLKRQELRSPVQER